MNFHTVQNPQPMTGGYPFPYPQERSGKKSKKKKSGPTFDRVDHPYTPQGPLPRNAVQMTQQRYMGHDMNVLDPFQVQEMTARDAQRQASRSSGSYIDPFNTPTIVGYTSNGGPIYRVVQPPTQPQVAQNGMIQNLQSQVSSLQSQIARLQNGARY